ncbi:DUF757-domain-containing protein [Tilletiopsis washingtonensis]|uniref:Protein PBDC1 homolog n=1 Tax=Tilletiopsis washingtonensis TaxID=58919 RepID=A0A316Z4J7_9BASI|nr:DUF757-domain-containing protein [Tilletiopsis washingtonensis]PWN95093.1 DUF757-domain-containing protein [Tilletiopsis washingtonensis]
MTSEFDANRAQNLPEIEKQMAVKCVEHAQTYWNLLEKLDARSLRLTKLDDDIYAHMLDAFPELAEGAAGDAAVGKIDEEEMKSESGKTRWREFIARYEGKVTDYNFGTLIRTDASEEYTQFNTTFVTRMQFYVYEIARNRRGLNDWVRTKAQKEAEEEKAKKKGKK